MPRHTIFERIKPHARRAADAAKKAGTRGFEAGKRGFDTLRGKASAGVEEVKLKTGSAANRANARVASGERPSFSNRTSNTGPAPEPAGGRVSGGGARGFLRGGLRAVGRFGPGAAVGAAALQAGIAGGKAAIDSPRGREALQLLDEGGSSGARSAKFFGLAGAGELDPFGNPTIDALNAPDQVRPQGDSGGFFSTDARSLNPNRFVEDLDQGPPSLNNRPLTRDQLLRGESIRDDEPNVPLGGEPTLRTEGRTFATTADATSEETGGLPTEDPNNKRLSLRDALAGFSRTDNALGDAMALNARLGLAGAFNKGLGDRNKFGLEQNKFSLEQDKFGETKRQNDFSNAIDLHSANLDAAAAAGDVTKQQADAKKEENKVFMDGLSNATTDQQKIDLTFTQARKDNFDKGSLAVQTMFSRVMREVAGEEDSAVGKIFNAIMPGFLGGGDPLSSIGDVFDGKAPLLSEDSMNAFSIQDDGGLYAVKEKDGPPSFIISLSDLPDTSAQFLQSVFARRNSLRQ